jgi:hypothetical protein
MTASSKDKSVPDTPSGAEPLKRRGDNVGQSGRWARDEDGTRRYGNEERFHSTDEAGAPPANPHEDKEGDRISETPRSGGYEGRFPPRGEGQANPDDRSRFRNRSYADAGGETSGEQPVAPGEDRWENERAEGYDKEYGRGHAKDDDDA